MELYQLLNNLASDLSNDQQDGQFNKTFFDDQSNGIKTIIARYHSLDLSSHKSDYVYDLFQEAFSLINDKSDESEYPNLNAISEVVIALCNEDRYNFELFVSLINSYPWEASNGLKDLLARAEPLRFELFVYLNDHVLSKGSEKWTKDFWSAFKKSIVPEFFLLQKPNLFLECSTGFAQLLMLLNVAFEDADRFQSIRYYSKQLKYIMGKYKLDPIRSLDLILQVSAYHIVHHYQFVIELLKLTDYWPSSNLGNCSVYELLNHGGNPIATRLIINYFNNSKPDTKYIDLTVHLINAGFVSFAAIFDCVTPDDDSIGEFVERKMEKLEKDSLEGSLNPLAMAVVLTDEDRAPSKLDEVKETDSVAETKISEEEKMTLLTESVENSPKWKLIERLLINGHFIPGLYALLKYPQFFAVNDNIAKCFLEAFDYMIQPIIKKSDIPSVSNSCRPILKLSHNGIPTKQDRLVRQYSSLEKYPRSIPGAEFVFYNKDWQENLTQIETIAEFIHYSHLIFDKIGPRIILSTKLVEHICAIAERDISRNAQDESSIDLWTDYYRKFMLPILGLIEDEQFVANAIYSVMKHFSFEKRYFMYNELSKKIAEDDIHVRLQFNKYQKRARSLLKSLSIDNITFKCRDVANYVSCNPLSTLPSILKQIENYDKVSELIVLSAEFFSEFAYDTLQYVLLTQLASERPTLQDDGITPKMWISRLSLFVAGLAKGCPKMDMSNIFVFLIKNLYKDPSLTLAILKELITQVAGIQPLYEVNWNTLLMINSGSFLKEMGRNLILDFREKYHHRSKAIINYLVELNAVSEMIIMLTNLNLKTQTENNVHYKILSTKCDESNTLLWSFIEMLKHVLSEEQFKSNVLPFNVLIEQYQFPVEWAFDIWRDYFDAKLVRSEVDAEEIKTILYNTNFSGIPVEKIEKKLLIDFWCLSLYDIRLEDDLYKKQQIIHEDKRKSTNVLKERHKLLSVVQTIKSDLSLHKSIIKKTRDLIETSKQVWFPQFSPERIATFLQYCVVPRLIFSPFDAIFCATFITETFTMQEVIEILKQLSSSNILGTLLFSSTVNESSNIATFLKDIVSKIENWRRNTTFNEDSTTKIVLLELYYQLTEQLTFALQETNYMSIRNTIQFFNFVSEVFPVVSEHLEMVLDTLDNLLEKEQREDIILPSNALKGHLKARLKTASKKSEFCEISSGEQEQLQAELDLIKKYEGAKESEKVESKRKEEAESREKDREQKEHERQQDAKSSSTSDSFAASSKSSMFSYSPTLSQVMDGLYKMEKYIKDAEYTRITPLIYDTPAQSDFRKLIKNPGNISGFRAKLKILFEDYYHQVTNNPPDHYRSVFENFVLRCKSAPLPQSEAPGSMYEDDLAPSKPSPKYDTDRRRTSTSNERYIPSEPRKTGSSRYQHNVGSTNLPKAPAKASKPAVTQTRSSVTTNPGSSSRFQSGLPSGPRKDSSTNRNINSSNRSELPTRPYSQAKNLSSTSSEARKRQLDGSYQGSSRFSNAKRPKPNDRSTSTQGSLPSGPKQQSSGSRYSR
ncbi:unnamed protein product [Kluyveromyces dobzhanskii CBS 2104]|uniref:THO complex subunit 2 n=1 Tax=Kluyveromyces dobzhanskii CBS 2104 TaxID=1427455 RepID=A0A0A8KZK3_9SACH|nr:unnamed protein product [Kluyveromyces dobzhanskii CBS 2104]